ncbi:MAG: hypothetical protein ACYDEX_23935 [Mobilitalea sp.]
MLSPLQWLLIKEYLEKGVSISALSRDLGFDRKTILKVKRSQYPFTYKKRGEELES